MKPYQSIRTGVVGVGSMGQNHARVYSEISNLTCVVDVNEVHGRSIAEKYGAQWYPDYHQIIDKVDAVTVAVPTSLHTKVAQELASKGINLLIEKPLAANSFEAKKIIDTVNEFNVTLAVGHIERHNPVVSYAKNAIINGEWGIPLSFSAKRFSNFPARITDVGVIFDLSVHDIDIINYLTGSSVTHVFAVGGKHRNDEFEDYVNLSFKYKNGAIGFCETNWLTPMKVREMHITTDKNYVTLNHLKQNLLVGKSKYGEIDSNNLFKVPIDFDLESIALDQREPLLVEIEDFLDSILKNRLPLVDGMAGLEVVSIAEACLKSLQESKTVFL